MPGCCCLNCHVRPEILVFDFGSKLCIWNGKNIPSCAKGGVIRHLKCFARVLYDMCQLNPTNFTELNGDMEETLDESLRVVRWNGNGDR